jgi:hypothetical protein
VGVVAGAVVSQHAPVPDLTVDVSGPGIVYDQLGQRTFFSSLQNVNVAQDDNGVSTSVAGGGNEKIVSVFLKFDRALSDPRVDGNSLTVFFRRDESFKFIVAQGAEAAAGTALPPPLRSDAILLADVTRTFGQTQILNANISTARRQDAFVVTGSPRSLRRGRTLEVVSDLLGFYNAHVGGSDDRHPASSIDYAGGGNWADGTTNPTATVEAQLDKLIADLAATSGAPKVGAAATAGAPNSLSAGSVKSQLDALLGFVNAHINLAAGAHAAAAITYAGGGAWADATTNPATTVEAQLDKVIADLAATSGAPKVGAAATAGAPNSLSAGSVKSQLDALLGFVNAHINLAAGAHAAAAITYAGGGNWADGTTNPATTVEAQLDKIVSDLVATAGAARIGAAASGNLPAGTIRSQLDALDATSVRTSVANTFTALQTFNGAGGDQNAALRTNENPTVRKLAWEMVGGSFTMRLYYGDTFFELTLNARWDGTNWVSDNSGLNSAKYEFQRTDMFMRRKAPTASAWADSAWDFNLEFDIAGSGGNSLTLSNAGFFTGPGTSVTYVAWQGQSPPSGNTNVGSGSTYKKRYPATPSSFTFSVQDSVNLASGPFSWAETDDGTGVFIGVTTANANTRFYTEVTVS